MSWQNYDDVRQQLVAGGLVIEELEVNTPRPKRVRVEGSREKRGWYWLHEITTGSGDRLIVGSWGVWSGDDNGAIKIEIKREGRERLTREQLDAIKARQAEDSKRAQAEREREAQRAAAQAERWWAQCADAGTSAYMTRKGLTRLYGARMSAAGNLVVPLQDVRGRVRGLQVIYGDPAVRKRKGRDKDYTPPGLAKLGSMFAIGSPVASGGVMLVCEGFATGASLHEATGLPVVVAFDAGNLAPVVKELARHYKRARILVCADDDYLNRCKACKKYTPNAEPVCAHCGAEHGQSNTGVLRAEAAALAVGGAWVMPIFPGERPVDSKGPTDFNDLHTHPAGGLSAVRAQIEGALSGLGWMQASGNAAREAATEGAGDSLLGIYDVTQAVDRWSIVYGGRGTLFDHVDHCLVPKGDVMDLLEDHGWREWKEHPGRRVVRLSEIGFDPAGTDRSIRCNLWSGWPTEPRHGVCDVLLDLLRYLCSAEDNAADVYNWVLKWLALPIQRPGAKMKTALVFHGPQGAGKNMFFEAVAAIYGTYARVIDQAALEDKFNDWASRLLFAIADEVVSRDELYHQKNRLKSYITGDTIRINPKNVASHEEANHVNTVFLSNEIQPLSLDEDDRRYTVVYTPAKLPQTFYREVRDEVEAGGIQAMHHYLLHLDLGDFSPWTLPIDTTSKQALIDLSLGSAQRFMRAWTTGEAGLPVCPCGSVDLYRAYARWCRDNGISKPRESNTFLGTVAKLPGWSSKVVHRYDNANHLGQTKSARMVIPPDELTAKAGRARPSGQAMAEWYTDAFFEFRQAAEVTT